MNCIECQETMVANLEGVLVSGKVVEMQNHLAGCPACQSEQTKLAKLHEQLMAHGGSAAHVTLVPAVMGRIRRQQAEAPATVWVLSHGLRWLLGYGAATAAIVLAVLLLSPKTPAGAAEVMVRGVKAAMRLTSVHLQGRIRSAPAENFLNISPNAEFTRVELWKEWAGQGRWRIEKPGRVVVMDGQSTIHFLRPLKSAVQVPAVPATMLPTSRALQLGGQTLPPDWAPFDTGWLHAIADIEHTLETELRRAQDKGWKMAVTRETTAGGILQAVVTIEATSGLPQGDYLHNRIFDTADTRRIYHFDDQSGRLQSVQVFLHDTGGDALVFEVTSIAYNEAFAPEVFRLDLPPDVVVQDVHPRLTGEDAHYTSLTAEQAARKFFEACGREDWTEVSAFYPTPADDRLKSAFGGLTVVSIGKAFTSAAYSGRFVPYEVKLKSGAKKKYNLALKQDERTGRWFVDGGF